jgi:gamma-glutamyltranspeptidase/glutathione hydrolase
MMVSFIQSNYMGFGSGVVVDGISLQNRGGTFRARAGPPELRRPDKRPYQTIIPGFVTQGRQAGDELRRDGRHHAAAGPRQVLIRIADYGQSPQAACDGPRFRVVQGMDVSVEEARHSASTLEELQRRGHRIVTIDDYNQFGSAQLLWKLDGGYFTASDRAAMGRPWVSDAEDLGRDQLGQRQEGAVGGRRARPEVRAHRRRHAVRRHQDARIPEA